MSAGLRAWARALAVLAALVAAVALAVWLVEPRAPSGPAAAGAFDTQRALAQLAQVARAPHPPGTAEHARVREHVIAELTAAGFEVTTQTQLVMSAWGDIARGGVMTNVLARRVGRAPAEPGVLLLAHYDSVQTGPGAGDDGYGVVALLEIARLLGAEPPRARTVIIALSDGEELGLLGARALAGHPWLAGVDVLVNLEARGNSGPALLFETIGPNLGPVRAARAAPRPQGNSLAQAVYERMPNNTDLSVFRDGRIAGVNFANIGSVHRYHAPSDTAANARPGTLWQLGSSVLALARVLADTPPAVALAPAHGGQATYFDLGGLVAVVYPASWNWLVTGAAAALLVALAVVLARRGRVRGRGVGIAAGLHLAAVAVAALVGVGLLVALRAARPELTSPAIRPAIIASVLVGGAWLGLALAALPLAVMSRLTPEERGVGGGVLWLVLTLLLHRHLPGGAFLFAAPLVALAGLALVGVLVDGPGVRRVAPVVLTLAGGVPALLLLAEVITLLGQGFLVMSLPAVVVLVVVALAPAAPVLAVARPPRPGLLPAGAAAIGLVGVAYALVGPLHDADAPRPHALLHVVDLDRGTAEWLTPDETPPAWSAARVPTRLPVADLVPAASDEGWQAWRGPAPMPAPVPEGPRAELLGDTTEGAQRALTVRLVAQPGSTMLTVDVPPGTGVQRASLDGQALVLRRGGLALQLFAPGTHTLSLTMSTEVTKLPLALTEQRPGLPPGTVDDRPTDVAVKPSLVLPPHAEIANGDMTLLLRRFAL